MALATKLKEIDIASRIEVFSDASLANTAITVTSPVGALRHILLVTITYSATITVDPTITLNSGLGSAYDTLLQSVDSGAGATDMVWIPDEELWIMDDDVLDVLAPAGGGGITSAIAIYTRSY